MSCDPEFRILISVQKMCPLANLRTYTNYHSRALNSRSKLRAEIGLRAAFEKLLLYQNSSLCTATFGEKVRGS